MNISQIELQDISVQVLKSKKHIFIYSKLRFFLSTIKYIQLMAVQIIFLSGKKGSEFGVNKICTTQTLKTAKKIHVKNMILQKMFKSIVLTAASSTFEVHFHGTNADRHGSTKDRSFRLHKQIKTPKLISYRKKLESREKKETTD